MREEFANSSATLTAHPIDYRKSARQRMAPMTYVEIGTENGGLLLDVSEGGLGLQAAHVLPIAHPMPVRFRLPGSGRTVEGSAEVVWLGLSQKQAGLRFVRMPEWARALIEEWVAREASEEQRGANTADTGEEAELPFRSPDDEERGAEAANEIFSRSAAEPFAEATPEAEERKRPLPPTGRATNTILTSTATEQPQTQEPPAEPSLPSYRLNETSLFGVEEPISQLLQVPVRRRGLSAIWTLLWLAAAACAFVLGVAIGTGKMELSGKAAALVEMLGWQQPPVPPPPRIPGDVLASLASPPATPAATENSRNNSTQSDRSATNGASPEENSASTSSAAPSPSSPDHTTAAPTTKGGPTATRVRPSAPPNPEKNFDKTRGKQPERHSVLVRAPGRGSMPLLLSLPAHTVLASQNLAITSRRAVEIAPIENAAFTSKPQRVTVGRLLFDPAPGLDGQDIESESGRVEILASIGLGGQVLEAKIVSGSAKFGAVAMRAIREWLYEPTLVDGRPVSSQDDLQFVFGRP